MITIQFHRAAFILPELIVLLCFSVRSCAQFSLPLQRMELTSAFGWRIHPVTGISDFHQGIDLSAKFEPIYAVIAGRVSAQGYHPILGNFIRIKQDGLEVIYGHLSVSLVETGQEVNPGQTLGMTGESGRVTGPHLHLSIKFRGSYLHPLQFMQGLSELR